MNQYRLYIVASLVVTLFLFGSCKNDKPIYMNSEEGLSNAQEKIEVLVKSMQIDSLSIRSSEGKSLISSIFIIATNSESKDSLKNTVEYIPKEKIILEKKSEIKKDALHDFNINLKDLFSHITSAQEMIPQGYAYNNNIKSIRYSASPFGDKYYFELEVKPLSDNPQENEYIDWYNSNANAAYEIRSNDLDSNHLDVKKNYVVSFCVENKILQIMKVE